MRRVGVYGLVVQQRALRIQTHHLATGPETRINAHHGLLPQRRRHEQLLKISCKNAYRLSIGRLF